VTDVDTGEPISGANVALVQSMTIPQPAHGRSVEISSYSTTSDADGKYAFPSWMEPVRFTDGRGGYYLGVPNPYRIRIEKLGYRQESTDGMNVKMKRQNR